MARIDESTTAAPAGRPASPESPRIVDDDRAVADSGPAPDDTPRKNLKGRQRLLRGLSRISSSPALAQFGRPRAASSPYGSVSSFSCVSLSLSSGSGSGSGSGSSALGAQAPTSRLSQHPSSLLDLVPGGCGPSTSGSLAGTQAASSESHPLYEGIETRLAIRKVDGAEMAVLVGHQQQNATASLPAELRSRKTDFNMWTKMPYEIKVHIFSFLLPRELVRASRVNRDFHGSCFDGQLWTRFDASEFYRDIPADSLAKIIVAAGPFVRDLNLRGCVQVEHYKRAEAVAKACRNLVSATLEGCSNLRRGTLHSLIRSNERLARINLTGLSAVTNSTCRIVADACPQLEMLDVSWCEHVDARGIKTIIERCPRLSDLRAGEVKGFDSLEVADALFQTNNLTRLVLGGCGDLGDAALRIMVQGTSPEVDVLTDRPVVPPRRWRHLDLSRCVSLTSHGLRALGHLVPRLEALQLAGCSALTDAALEPVLASTPRLTHLELENMPELTNAVLSEHLAKSPCAAGLRHLTVSYCGSLGDAGMLPVLRACRSLEVVEMDNTRVSDLVLAEAAAMVLARSGRTRDRSRRPRLSLRMVVYDCQNVTWTGVREVLSRNAEVVTIASKKPPSSTPPRGEEQQSTVPVPVVVAAPTSATAETSSAGIDDRSLPVLSGATAPPASDESSLRPPPPRLASAPPSKQEKLYPTEIIALKCFYGWQMTVDEHTKRVLQTDYGSASRLERKWADYMQASEEAGAAGAGVRRRRRRAREAQLAHADEEDGGGIFGGTGRRRARTAACVVM